MLDTMEELGLEPNVTLHHFTHPTWFEDLGGFRKEENIPLFVEWAQFMFRTFHKRIRLWATFNEPTVSRCNIQLPLLSACSTLPVSCLLPMDDLV